MKRILAALAALCILTPAGLAALGSGAQADTSNVGKIRITEYGFNAVGTDKSSNRNEEFVRLVNTSGAPVDVTGWLLHDTYQNAAGDYGNRYTFRTSDLPTGSPFLSEGRFVVPAGAQVYVYQGSGVDSTPTNTTAAIYRNANHMWNNGGDTIYLRDTDGTVVARVTYSSYRVRLW